MVGVSLMNINEMFEDQYEEITEKDYVDPSEDNEIPKLDDLRKTKLTLGQINRLRLIRDVRNFELKSNLENIRKQYGRPLGGNEVGI
jgi:hypothetical protein